MLRHWKLFVVNRTSLCALQKICPSYIEQSAQTPRVCSGTITNCVMFRSYTSIGQDTKESFNLMNPVSKSSSTTLRVKKISKAMKAYLENAKNHEDFVLSKNEEFEIGKQHLANMMGLEAASMTQDDVDKAIRYLLPSGLYEPKARPMMKPPIEIYPKQKAAQFDYLGRPFNTFFYTLRANFYAALHEIVGKFHELDGFEDKMIRKGIAEPPPETVINLSGGNWLTIEQMSELFVERIHKEEYNFFVSTLIRLSEHPYAFRCKDFIWQYRKDFEDISIMQDIPELIAEENGMLYIESDGRKKTAKAHAKVFANGTGKVTINERDISYFYNVQEREQIMFPLEVSEMLGKVDVVATVDGGGIVSQASAIRYAISMCLRSFVPTETCERMRLAGLLTKDFRRRERKKPGQKGARAKYKWLKR